MEDVEHEIGRRPIQAACRLVRKYEFGSVGDRSGDGGPLCLASRHSRGPSVLLLDEPEPSQQLGHAEVALPPLPLIETKRKGNVLRQAELRHQLGELENEPEAGPTQPRTLLDIHPLDRRFSVVDLSCTWDQQSGKTVQESSFARATGTAQYNYLARPNCE